MSEYYATYFNGGPLRDDTLTCNQLHHFALRVAGELNAPAPVVMPPARAAADDIASDGTGSEDDPEPIEVVLENDELWAHAAHLNWRMKSDYAFSAGEMAELRDRLSQEGMLPQVQRAVRLLAAAWSAAYYRLDRSEVLQIVALGKDMATSAADGGLLEFVRNELQPAGLIERVVG